MSVPGGAIPLRGLRGADSATGLLRSRGRLGTAISGGPIVDAKKLRVPVRDLQPAAGGPESHVGGLGWGLRGSLFRMRSNLFIPR